MLTLSLCMKGEMTTEEEGNCNVGEEHEREVEMQRNFHEATTELRALSKIITSIQALASS